LRLLIIAITILWTTEVFAPNVYYTEAMWNMEEEQLAQENKELDTILSIREYVYNYAPGLSQMENEDIAEAILTASQKYDLDIALIMAIIETESSWRPDVTGEQGELGLMQIKKQWCPYFKLTNTMALNVEVNIDYGCYKIRHELNRAKGDLNKALMEYNGVITNFKAGKTYVAKVRAAMARINGFMNGE